MVCHKCCISCDKEKKQCEDYKERGRAVNKAIYRAKKNQKARQG